MTTLSSFIVPHCMYYYHLFNKFPAVRHLGCFEFFNVISNATNKIFSFPGPIKLVSENKFLKVQLPEWRGRTCLRLCTHTTRPPLWEAGPADAATHTPSKYFRL